MGDDKTKRKATNIGSYLWYIIPKRRGHTKINACVKQAPYNWVLNYPQGVQYPIENEWLKVYIDVQNEKQLVPKMLLKVSFREIQNSMESPPAEGGLKEERYKYNNISMSDSELHTIIPPHIHLKNV